jgi:LmbE family N-acetylglucosaminyl deacetylase
MTKRILIVGAHPDDEVLGVGGTIARHVEAGDRVSVLLLTDGVRARHNVTEPQKQAARKACCALGVENVCFADLPDQGLDNLPLLEVIAPITRAVKELRPEIVYTHHRGDANQDHRAAFEATIVAVRPSDGSPVRRLLCYEVASSTEWAPQFNDWAFVPNVFVDISSTLEAKLAALEAYRDTFESEIKPFPHPRSPEAVRCYAQQRGISVGLHAAEAFALGREIVRT